MSTYSNLPRQKVIDACEKVISSVMKERAKRKEEVIHNIMNRKTTLSWFDKLFDTKIAPQPTREEAEKIYDNCTFDGDFETYRLIIRVFKYGREDINKCKTILSLAKVSDEETIKVSAADFTWFEEFYEE